MSACLCVLEMDLFLIMCASEWEKVCIYICVCFFYSDSFSINSVQYTWYLSFAAQQLLLMIFSIGYLHYTRLGVCILFQIPDTLLFYWKYRSFWFFFSLFCRNFRVVHSHSFVCVVFQGPLFLISFIAWCCCWCQIKW